MTGGLQMVMSATPSAPTSMVTRIDPAMAWLRRLEDLGIDGLERGERGRGESWEKKLVLAEVTCTALFIELGGREDDWR